MATFLAEVELPGEKEWKANRINQAAKHSDIILEKIKEFETKRREDEMMREEMENKRLELLTGSPNGFPEGTPSSKKRADNNKGEDSVDLKDISLEASDRTHVTDRGNFTTNGKNMRNMNEDVNVSS